MSNSTDNKNYIGLSAEQLEQRLQELEKELGTQLRLNEMLRQEEARLRQRLAESENKRRQLMETTEFARSLPGRAAKKVWHLWHNVRNRAAAVSMASFHKPEKHEFHSRAASFKLRASSLREMKIACIMDRFSFDCFGAECQLLQLTPDNWQNEMEGFDPDMLFIESAWQGKDNLWYRKVAHAGKELYSLTEYCCLKGIPVVFWTKEDPVHFDAFFGAAQMADFVFTTEIDCVQRYKAHFGHDNVYLLHFAAQPAIHNPIEKYDRKDCFCFAGAYYHNYPNRCKIFDAFADVFDETKGFDIYDRNYGNARPEHAFPARYDKNILGSLDPSEIDVAYKGYNYGVNMNSIAQSQTMFARRVFELFASNTIVVGNFSRGLSNLFGDLTISTDDAATLAARLEQHCSDEETMRKLRLLCLRRVMSEHLYEDRLAYIVEKVYGADLRPKQPAVEIIGLAADADQAKRIIDAYRRQDYENCHLTLICDGVVCTADDVSRINSSDAENTRLSSLRGFDWVTVFNADDYYAPNYLSDLMLGSRHTEARAYGKADYYCAQGGEAVISDRSRTYRFAESLDLRCAVANAESLAEETVAALPFLSLCGEGLFSADEFGYCRSWQGEVCPAADDLIIADTGMHIADLQREAEKIRPREGSSCMLDMEEFSNSLKLNNKNVTCSFINRRLLIESQLEENEQYFIWCRRSLSVEEFADNGEVNVIFMGSGTVNFRGYCTFYDKDRNRLATHHAMINRHLRCPVPEGADYFLLSLKVMGKDTFALTGITIGAGVSILSGSFLSRSNVLVLTNHYPSAAEPYRNMFVHKRVLEYRRAGLVCDVMRMHASAQPGYREYMGVNVAEGQANLLEDILSSGRIDTLCVHFLDRTMWQVIKEHLDHLHIVIWCHGADIQPWWRRKFNIPEDQLEKQQKLSDERMALWKEVFAALPDNDITMVFVSQYAADETMEDYGIELDRRHYRIIHNFIDTELFNYEPKDASQRNRILTIKSFSNKNYANDLTANAILTLSKLPEFAEMEFDIYGRGPLFAQETAPLEGFANVHLHEQFLSHSEIAALHKTHGIYIASTRCDTQGVSRDEAMSSGLVPIANAVTAIPEFVDESCGILVPAEDHHGIAEGILRLHRDPELFAFLSAGAAQRVRTQTSREHTIAKEIELIKGKKD